MKKAVPDEAGSLNRLGSLQQDDNGKKDRI